MWTKVLLEIVSHSKRPSCKQKLVYARRDLPVIVVLFLSWRGGERQAIVSFLPLCSVLFPPKNRPPRPYSFCGIHLNTCCWVAIQEYFCNNEMSMLSELYQDSRVICDEKAECSFARRLQTIACNLTITAFVAGCGIPPFSSLDFFSFCAKSSFLLLQKEPLYDNF